jgi:hypothetical protein
MAGTGEGVVLSGGPPSYHERQITPQQYCDMQLGYLASLGAEVELVYVAVGDEPGVVEPIVIVDVNRTFWAGSTPDDSRLVSLEDKEAWLERNCVTFYRSSKGADGAAQYRYDHFPAYELGLALPAGSNSWPSYLFWYLRWAGQTENAQDR